MRLLGMSIYTYGIHIPKSYIHIYIYTQIHIYILYVNIYHVYIYIRHTYRQMHISIYMHIQYKRRCNAYICIYDRYTCIYIYACMNTYIYIYVYIYIYILLSLSLSLSLSLFTCIYIYIYVCVYIYIQNCLSIPTPYMIEHVGALSTAVDILLGVFRCQRHLWLHVPLLFLNMWLWLSKPMGFYFGVGAPPILVYFSGDWDVHWGYGLLTHGNVGANQLGALLSDFV